MTWGSRVAGSIEIERPIEDVFDFVADQRNEPQYNPEMATADKLTEGPVGLGTTFRATSTGYGEPITMTIELTSFERPGHIASTTHMDRMDIDGGLRFAEIPGGTRMSWSWDLHPKGALRLMGPVLGLMGRRSEEKIWAGLKDHLEHR